MPPKENEIGLSELSYALEEQRKEINRMKYIVCCPMCDNDKCCYGTDKCEAEIWAKEKGDKNAR